MTVTYRKASECPPVTGDVLLRRLDDPENLQPRWTLRGNRRDGWYGVRVYDTTATYSPFDFVIAPSIPTSYATAADALRPRGSISTGEG